MLKSEQQLRAEFEAADERYQEARRAYENACQARRRAKAALGEARSTTGQAARRREYVARRREYVKREGSLRERVRYAWNELEMAMGREPTLSEVVIKSGLSVTECTRLIPLRNVHIVS